MLALRTHKLTLTLSEKLYAGVEPEAQPNTAYKWGFAGKVSKTDRNALAAAKDDIHSATWNRPSGSASTQPTSSSSRRAMGPSMPSAADLTYAKEISSEQAILDRKNERKRQRNEERDRVEDMVGPKPVGREGQMEAKRAKREGNKSFQEAKDEGFSAVDEKTLLGGGDSFRDA
jgi:hypothetical protein